jgi:hypothetical protein
MGTTRTVTQLISDIRIRCDLESHTTRHPDSIITGFIQESFERMREGMVDAGSSRYLTWIRLTKNTPTTGTYPYWEDFGGSTFNLWGTSVGSYTHIKQIKVLIGGKYVLLKRGTYEEVSSRTSNTNQIPDMWCIVGENGQTFGQLLNSGPAYGNQMIYVNGNISSIDIYALPVTAVLSSSSELILESIGTDYIIYDVAVKLASRDNELSAQGQLWLAERDSAWNKIKAAIKEESSKPYQRSSILDGGRKRASLYGRW